MMASAHPSLTAPSLKIDPITPRTTMGRNEPCWCRSGLKYKKCHLDRDQQTPVNIFEVETKLVAQLRDGYCSHPDPTDDPCSPVIAKSHTVQKKGGIAAIAEAGHVLTVKPVMRDMIDSKGSPSPRKIGVNSASVFPGFCSKHDTTLFKPIESKTLLLNKDSAFLFSYRAIAYERFAKEAQSKAVYAQREIDRGRPFLQQVMVQKRVHAFAAGVEIGLRDVGRWKMQFDRRLLSGARDDFHFLAVKFDRVLPIVASVAFQPEFDVNGKPLQRLGRESADLEHITLNVTSFAGQTVRVLGWIGGLDGPAQAFADAFSGVSNDRKADALVRLLFIQTDNLFLRPSWWDALPHAQQSSFRNMVLSGSTMKARSANEYVDGTSALVVAVAVETVSD